MASVLDDSTTSPSYPSFAIRDSDTAQSRGFVRSISTKESSSFTEFPFTPSSCLPNPTLSRSLQNSPLSSPLIQPAIANASHNNNDQFRNRTTTTYRCVSSVLKKDGQILSMAVSNNGFVYTGSHANIIRVWKLPEFTECQQLKTKACTVVALEVSSNDKVYAAYGDGKIRVWRRTLEKGLLKHVRVCTIPKPGGYVRSYITGSARDKTMKHLGPITSIALNASDDIIYSASMDRTVKVWQISDLKCIETIRAHSDPINDIIIADNGILYTASDDATIRVWRRNFCPGDRPHSLTITLPAKNSPVKTLMLTPDGGILYGGCTDGYIQYWFRGSFPGQVQYGGALNGHTHAVMCLANVGNYMVSGSADCTSRVWARKSDGQHSCLAVLVGHRGPVRCAAAFVGEIGENSEDSCMVCTGSLDGVVKVWCVTSMNNVNHYRSPDGIEYFEL